MPSPEEFVQQQFLQHDYDPAKRHEYYLKTRQLKGRGKGPGFEISGHSRPGVQISPTKKSHLAKPTKTIQEQVDELKARLAKLRKVLEELVKAAQERSGVEPADTKKSNDKSKKQTAKQKADAAKKAKAYREKHKNDPPSTPSEQLKQVKAQIKAMQAKIKKARADLAKAKKKSKSKAGSVGASELHIHN